MLEGDLLLATFARENLSSMKEDEVREFDKVNQRFDFTLLVSCGSLFLLW